MVSLNAVTDSSNSGSNVTKVMTETPAFFNASSNCSCEVSSWMLGSTNGQLSLYRDVHGAGGSSLAFLGLAFSSFSC